MFNEVLIDSSRWVQTPTMYYVVMCALVRKLLLRKTELSYYLVLRSSEVWNSPIFLDYLVLDYLWFLDYLVLDYLVLRSSEVWIFVLESILFSFLDYLVLRSLVLVCVILFINHGSFNSILLVPKSILE